MSQLIPFDPIIAEALEEKLSTTLFQSADIFIKFYNSGNLSVKADDVAAIATEIEATYKNVKIQGKQLVFISKAEVELTEVVHALHKWEILTKVRDRLSKVATITDDTVLRFSPEAVGTLEKGLPQEDGTLNFERLFDEKFFKPADEALAAELVDDISSGDAGRFLVKDALEQDDSFITDIHQLTIG